MLIFNLGLVLSLLLLKLTKISLAFRCTSSSTTTEPRGRTSSGVSFKRANTCGESPELQRLGSNPADN